jgi:hypothetical protein
MFSALLGELAALAGGGLLDQGGGGLVGQIDGGAAPRTGIFGGTVGPALKDMFVSTVQDSLGGTIDGAQSAFKNPKKSMGDALKSTTLAKLMQDPDDYFKTRVKDFVDTKGRAPSPSEFENMKKEMLEMREQAMRAMQGGQGSLPVGGFVNQNTNFLNTAQQRLGY